MKASLPFVIRRLVLFALTPLPAVACGTVAIVESTGGGHATGSGGSPVTGSSGSSGTGGNPFTVASSSGSPSCGSPGTGGSPADPCAPRWISGNGVKGGQVLFPCGLPPAAMDGGSALNQCAPYCMGSMCFNLCLVIIDGGYQGPAWADVDGSTEPTVVLCTQDHTGRRPAGLQDPDARRGGSSLGEILARTAYLEAAAVEAFRDLAAQLEAHGAPQALVKRLRRAAREEVRHARIVGALARARGAAPADVVVEDPSPRSLLTLALENEREGCVRETWGAACAVAQSERAADPEVREAMRRIARDELGHAALSWDMGAWLAERLSDEERALCATERERAIAELEREVDALHGGGAPWAAALGLPTRAESCAILAAMRTAVWSGKPGARRPDRFSASC
jgi:hypothetical protein